LILPLQEYETQRSFLVFNGQGGMPSTPWTGSIPEVAMMRRGHPREPSLSKKKLKKSRTKVGLIPIIVFIVVVIAVAALVIPQSIKLEDQENAHGQGHQ
jgi:hypothetical protein